MRVGKQEGLISPVKSLSPKLETKISTLHRPKLPNINSTKRLSQRYFLNTSESPRDPKTTQKNPSTMDIPSPKSNEKKKLSVKFCADEGNLLRKSPTLSILEESNLVEIHDTVLTYWKSEVSNLKAELTKSNNTLNYHKSVLASLEKSLHLDLSQEMFYPSISTEDPSLIEKENEQIHIITETIQKLQTELTQAQEIIKSKEKQEKHLHHSLKQEINSLATENSSLKSYAQDLSKKIEKVKTSKTKLKTQTEEVQNEVKNSLLTSEKAINDLKSDLKLKAEELDQLQEIINRNETLKRRQAENMKDLELELSNLKRDYKKLDFNHEALKEKHQQLLELFIESKEKSSVLSENIEKLEIKTTKLESLELQNFELTDEIKKNFEKIDSLKYIIEMQRQQFTKKEQTYHENIQDLLEKIDQIKLLSEVNQAESLKLKKSLTLRDYNEDLSSFTKEEVLRSINRARLSEEIAAGQIVEIEKLRKTQDYYKALLTSKNEIIEKLLKENQEKPLQVVKEKNLIDLIKELKSKMICKSCSESQEVSFLAPCHHVFCGKCLPEVKRCPFCQSIFSFVSPVSYLDSLHSLVQHLDDFLY